MGSRAEPRLAQVLCGIHLIVLAGILLPFGFSLLGVHSAGVGAVVEQRIADATFSPTSENVMLRVIVLAVAFTCTGCVSLAPEAERVRFTRSAADVANCELVGNVEGLGRGGLVCAKPCELDLRNRTAALGGDTVLFTGGGTGMAYRCRK
jgi:hypothetical protein